MLCSAYIFLKFFENISLGIEPVNKEQSTEYLLYFTKQFEKVKEPYRANVS